MPQTNNCAKIAAMNATTASNDYPYPPPLKKHSAPKCYNQPESWNRFYGESTNARIEKESLPTHRDVRTVYLKNVITSPNITVGDYTIYNDFVCDPRDFQKNNALYHYPVNGDRLVMCKFSSVACGAKSSSPA